MVIVVVLLGALAILRRRRGPRRSSTTSSDHRDESIPTLAQQIEASAGFGGDEARLGVLVDHDPL
jgi:hypothetical protein